MTTLRKTYLALLVAVGMLAAVPAAHAQLGIAAGANFNSLSDVSDDANSASFDNATGFHAGIFYDASFGPLALRPGVFYMDLGTFEGEGEGINFEDDLDLSLVEIPIDARFQLLSLPLIKPYALAGPVLRINVSDPDEYDEAFNSTSLAGNVGLGVEINLPGQGVRLFPEFRYSFGLTRYAEDFEFAGQQVTIEDEARLNVYMVRLGIGL